MDDSTPLVSVTRTQSSTNLIKNSDTVTDDTLNFGVTHADSLPKSSVLVLASSFDETIAKRDSNQRKAILAISVEERDRDKEDSEIKTKAIAASGDGDGKTNFKLSREASKGGHHMRRKLNSGEYFSTKEFEVALQEKHSDIVGVLTEEA